MALSLTTYYSQKEAGNTIKDKMTLPAKLKELIVSLYFKEIKIYGNKNTPKKCPVLYISNHRNGAIDGYVLMKAIPNVKFIVGKNLTHLWFLSLFFGGQIEVYRNAESHSEKKFNREQLVFSAKTVSKGDPVLIFPEGTSSLGPRLLPLQKGTAYICKKVREMLPEKDSFYIVPIGLHYVAGWSFRSRAEIHFGKPTRLVDMNNQGNGIESMLRELMVTYGDSEEQILTESLATFYLNSGLNGSFFRKKQQNNISHLLTAKKIHDIRTNLDEKNISILYKEFGLLLNRKDLKYFHGSPIIQAQVSFPERVVYFFQTIILTAAFIPNCLVLLIPYQVSKKLADDNNVVTLYKVLVGVPVLILQSLIFLSALMLSCNMRVIFLALVFYASVTLVALYSYDHWRRLRVIVHNTKCPYKHQLVKLYQRLEKAL